MNILIACDKFKGSLDAIQVCQIIHDGLFDSAMECQFIMEPLADGGEGSLAILQKFIPSNKLTIDTFDPLGRDLSARYLFTGEHAFIELASASGLQLLEPTEFDPMLTSTYGTGVIIRDAISKGAKKISLFLGGSSTNDGGAGILHALGFVFSDVNNRVIYPTGENLIDIKNIEFPNTVNWRDIEFEVICDVKNTLFGEAGAACVYAPQKGASEEDVKWLDDGLRHWAELILDTTGTEISLVKSGGAAGGIAAGLYGLLNANLRAGFQYISALTSLEKSISEADLVISGEGKLDSQTWNGKVVGGVADLCIEHNKPLYLLAGTSDPSFDGSHDVRPKGVYLITDKSDSLEDGIQHAEQYLSELVEQMVVDLKREYYK